MDDLTLALGDMPTQDLRERLKTAEETLRAIRADQIDALVIGPSGKAQIRTLDGADEPYRVFVEAMGQGAATLAPHGTILYCNSAFASMLERTVEELIGSSVYSYVDAQDDGLLRAMLWDAL